MEKVNTKATASEVLAALLDAGLSHRQAHFLAAQSALETANWQQGFWNWNLGNISTISRDPAKFATLETSQGPLNIKVYPSLMEGALGFVNYLKSRSAELLELAEVQDFDNYVRRLVELKYFIEDPPKYTREDYLRGMRARYDWLASVFHTGVLEEAYGSLKGGWEVVALFVAIAAGIGYLLERHKKR